MIAKSNNLEVWLRGALPDFLPILQPVVHALMQAREEIDTLMQGFSEVKLWKKPAGIASVGFHLQHLTGVLDRLFTYARSEALTQVQLDYLAKEGKENDEIKVEDLLKNFEKQIEKSLEQLQSTNEATLTEKREVGRAKLPSTVLGLYVHAAEHTMRHLGQLLVTVKVLQN